MSENKENKENKEKDINGKIVSLLKLFKKFLGKGAVDILAVILALYYLDIFNVIKTPIKHLTDISVFDIMLMVSVIAILTALIRTLYIQHKEKTKQYVVLKKAETEYITKNFEKYLKENKIELH
ncbi:MAG: hypothetical protein GF329_15125 [Candidatus Lokiarchaeota archaeon]|nr:hypothetical protein [Candidatus Lokiarchaeota archaeon]